MIGTIVWYEKIYPDSSNLQTINLATTVWKKGAKLAISLSIKYSYFPLNIY